MAVETYGEEFKNVSMKIFAGNDPTLLDQVTPHEIILGESLTTPGIQTTVRVQSYFHNIPIKNLDNFKGTNITILLEKPILAKFNLPSQLKVSQTIYRLENRTKLNNVVEEYTIRACDQTLLNDAETLVSKSWKCTTPSSIVSEMLGSCVGARSTDVEGSAPARDYVANSIHPFRVIDQQAEAALASGNDPSFIHYMTYQNLGTHHFRSLYSLTRQNPVMEYFFDETASLSGYGNPSAIMTHSFPCDFDLLSDLLNGIGPDGSSMTSLISFNPLSRISSMLGNQIRGCGSGSAILNAAMSNFGSEQQQNACPDYSQFFALKRQARMALLEEDKIALKITVPWNPVLNAGKIIKVTLNNKNDQSKKNYGSGNYLIKSLTHNIKFGGFATTTMDCVAQTVGQGGIV